MNILARLNRWYRGRKWWRGIKKQAKLVEDWEKAKPSKGVIDFAKLYEQAMKEGGAESARRFHEEHLCQPFTSRSLYDEICEASADIGSLQQELEIGKRGFLMLASELKKRGAIIPNMHDGPVVPQRILTPFAEIIVNLSPFFDSRNRGNPLFRLHKNQTCVRRN